MQVVCGYCGWTLEVGSDQAGQVLPCPRCGQPVRIPRLGEPVEAEDGGGFADEAREAMKRAPTARVTCGGCGHVFVAGLRLCGRAVRCPACKVAVRIPYPEEPDELRSGLRTAAPTDQPVDPSDEPLEAGADDPAPGNASDPTGRRRGWAMVLIAALVFGAAAVCVILWAR
jgi:hypothetical protein